MLEASEPLVNPIFGEARTPLGGKDVGTDALTPAMLEVVIQGAARLVQYIDVTKLLALVSDMEPTNLWTDMGVSHQQVRHIAHAASGPVPQGEDRFAAQVARFLQELHRTNRWSGDKMRGANTCCALISTPRVGLRARACFS